MESDILSDDFVETETFDLGTLEISKTCAKTFTFRKVESWVSFPPFQVLCKCNSKLTDFNFQRRCPQLTWK